MKIILVGIHNKPQTLPLSWDTKSGKLLQRVIDDFPTLLFQKTNLYNLDYWPVHGQKLHYASDWHTRIKPNKEDIIILLGNEVQDNFIKRDHIILHFNHPASIRSHKKMDRYVKSMITKIREKI